MLYERHYLDFSRGHKLCRYCAKFHPIAHGLCAGCIDRLLAMRFAVEQGGLSDWPDRNHKVMMVEVKR